MYLFFRPTRGFQGKAQGVGFFFGLFDRGQQILGQLKSKTPPPGDFPENIPPAVLCKAKKNDACFDFSRLHGGGGRGGKYILFLGISYFLDFFVFYKYKSQERFRILEDFITIYGVRAMVVRKFNFKNCYFFFGCFFFFLQIFFFLLFFFLFFSGFLFPAFLFVF